MSSPMLTEAAVRVAADEWDHAPDGDDERWARDALTAFLAAQDRHALTGAVWAALIAEPIADGPAAIRQVIDALLGPEAT